MVHGITGSISSFPHYLLNMEWISRWWSSNVISSTHRIKYCEAANNKKKKRTKRKKESNPSFSVVLAGYETINDWRRYTIIHTHIYFGFCNYQAQLLWIEPMIWNVTNSCFQLFLGVSDRKPIFQCHSARLSVRECERASASKSGYWLATMAWFHESTVWQAILYNQQRVFPTHLTKNVPTEQRSTVSEQGMSHLFDWIKYFNWNDVRLVWLVRAFIHRRWRKVCTHT